MIIMLFVKRAIFTNNITQGEIQMRRIRFCLICLLLCFSGATWADMLIIAHKGVPETTISENELQDIFLGKRVQWQDNSAIHPATLKVKDLHSAFLKQYIKKSVSKWNAHWKRMVFTGNGTPPKQFKTEQELLEYVTETEGAIGYIDAETLVDNNKLIMLEVQ
jgi:ABC-type phosphate transport system substrate-binding protein